MHRLILAGGGHAQLSVLRALATQKLEIDVVLVTPSPYQIYSGMLPGWMAGHYSDEQCRIDLRPLAQAAGARLVLAEITGIDANRNMVRLSDGSRLDYDTLSLDIGSETNTAWVQKADQRLLPIKPLDDFVQRWPSILADATKNENYQLVIVGGGAAGVELAFAAQYAFSVRAFKAKTVLVASEHGLLPGHAKNVQDRARKLILQRGIELLQAKAVDVEAGLQLSTGELLTADCIIAATGACPARWLQKTELARDEQDYLLVDQQQRSISHGNVFAAGDVCVRTDIRLSRSGVHAVFAGPVLANNLLSNFTGKPMQEYRPRKKSLYLLATGPKHAIASWGWFSAQGHWVWRWKNAIDQGFMRKYQTI